MFSTFKRVALLCICTGIWYYTLFAISHPKILYYTLLEISNSLCSHPFLCPGEFLILFSFWRVFGGAHFLVEVLDSAQTMQRSAEHFINQERRGNCTRICQCNGRLHTKISSTVMQDLSILLFLTPYALVQSHSLMGEPPYT